MRSKGMKRCAVAVGVASLLAVVAASAAPGDTTYGGTTAEGTKVKLTVAKAGNATVFKIARTEATCDEGRLETEATTLRHFDVSDPGAFSDKRKSKVQDGRYLLRDTFQTTGEIAADQGGWTGTYQKRTKVLKDGRRVDTCVLSTTWEVQ